MHTPKTEEETKATPLAELSAQFAHWRATRDSRKSRVPTHLRTQAVRLLKHHKKSHVIKALGINSTMLKSWQPQSETPATPSIAHDAFIPLPIQQEPDHSDTVEVRLSNPQGIELSLKGHFSIAQLIALSQGLQSSIEASL